MRYDEYNTAICKNCTNIAKVKIKELSNGILEDRAMMICIKKKVRLDNILDVRQCSSFEYRDNEVIQEGLFDVDISATAYATVSVYAETEEDAEEIALQQVCDKDWEIDDCTVDKVEVIKAPKTTLGKIPTIASGIEHRNQTKIDAY